MMLAKKENKKKVVKAEGSGLRPFSDTITVIKSTSCAQTVLKLLFDSREFFVPIAKRIRQWRMLATAFNLDQVP